MRDTSGPHPELLAQAIHWPSVNRLALPLVEALKRDARALRLGVHALANGATVIDAGIEHPGGLEAGRRIAEICMGGLGQVSVLPGCRFPDWPWQVAVGSQEPVLACLGSQYAGWSLSHGEGKAAFHAMASGPGRAAAGKEAVFRELGYEDSATDVCFVLETDRMPPPELADKIAKDCALSPNRVTLILTPTRSLAGGLQIVARVLEVGVHKAHALGFPLHQLIDGVGAAPLCPPAADFLTAMGRSNDAILFGGELHLYVQCAPGDAEQLAATLPATVSRDYGRPFRDVFKAANFDFYSIDPLLFAPAVAMVTEMRSGKTFRAGALNASLLAQSFA